MSFESRPDYHEDKRGINQEQDITVSVDGLPETREEQKAEQELEKAEVLETMFGGNAGKEHKVEKGKTEVFKRGHIWQKRLPSKGRVREETSITQARRISTKNLD